MKMSNLEDLISRLQDKLPEIKKKYDILKIGVFGSYVRDEQEDNSDLDILVELGDSITLFGFSALQRDLSEYLEVKVDLVDQEGLKANIGKQILSEVFYID